MPTPPLTDEQCLEALKALEDAENKTEAARSLGMNRMTYTHRLRTAQERGLHLSDGIRGAVSTAALKPSEAKAGWIVDVDPETGSRKSTYWRAPEEEPEPPEDILEKIADRLEKIRPAPFIKRPEHTRADIRNWIPVSDVHMSMRVGDYGTAECVDRLKAGMTDIMDRMAPAECAIICNMGDFTEQNDPSNLTPRSKHPLAVDAEYDDTTDVATDVTAWMIEHALSKSDHVIYKALKGNHDPNTARILRAALKQRYRNDERVTIETDGIENFAHSWEGNFIGAHHGDLRKKPMEYVLAFATRYPQYWADAVFREMWTGHLHHLKEIGKDETGMSFHQVRAIAPLGRHSIEEMYDSPSEMIGVTYRKGGGRLTTVSHGFWCQS